MAVNELQDPHDLFDEVCRVLTESRGGKGVGKAAKRLLSNDAAGTILVGITPEGQIITYDRSSWWLRRNSLDQAGRHDESASSVIETIKNYMSLEQWIRAQPDDYFSWIHPRYQWLR